MFVTELWGFVPKSCCVLTAQDNEKQGKEVQKFEKGKSGGWDKFNSPEILRNKWRDLFSTLSRNYFIVSTNFHLSNRQNPWVSSFSVIQSRRTREKQGWVEIQVQGSPNAMSIFVIIVLQVKDDQSTNPNQKTCGVVSRSKGSIVWNGVTFLARTAMIMANIYCELILCPVIALSRSALYCGWYV